MISSTPTNAEISQTVKRLELCKPTPDIFTDALIAIRWLQSDVACLENKLDAKAECQVKLWDCRQEAVRLKRPEVHGEIPT